jgi:kynurenine formamidase
MDHVHDSRLMAPHADNELLEALEVFRQGRWIDLTHTFDENIPHCPKFQRARRVTLYSYDGSGATQGSGFLAHEYCHAGQWGTHVDPPAHFIEGRRFQDEIPVTEMLLPLVVLDVSERVAASADYCVTMDDVNAWEARHGRIGEGSFVALRTDWSKRWPNQEAMLNRDSEGTAHFPGWSREVITYLYDVRKITASGHDTSDTDPGVVVSRGEAPLEAFILQHDKWQIELLAHLDQVPKQGAVIVATWPKPRQGSGFPARVFAIAPSIKE